VATTLAVVSAAAVPATDWSHGPDAARAAALDAPDANWNDQEYVAGNLHAATLTARANPYTGTYSSGCNAVSGTPTEFDFSTPTGLPVVVTGFQVVVALNSDSTQLSGNYDDTTGGQHTISGSPFTVTPDTNGNANWKISLNRINIGVLDTGSANFDGTVSVYPKIGNWIGTTALVGNWNITLNWIPLTQTPATNVTCSWSS
jgi:hypothetical protein